MTSVFISYCRRNSYLAHQLNASLQQAGCRTFFDQQDITMSDEWQARIQTAIRDHEIFLYLWSPEAAASPIVQEEFHLAQSLRAPGEIHVVLVAGDSRMMPDEIRKMHHENLSRDYWANLPKVLKQLGLPATVSPPARLSSGKQTVDEVACAVPEALQRTWHMNGINYLSFPVAVNGYAICRRVLPEGDTLEMPDDIQIVLQFTGKGRNTVEHVLEFLVATAQKPSILHFEGPRKGESYDLPSTPNEQHVWTECIDFILLNTESLAGGRRRHFFLDSPQALVFPVASQLNVRNAYVVYSFTGKPSAAQRYLEVYRT